MLHPATLYSLVPLNHAPCFYSPLCAPGSFPAEFPNLSTTRLFGSNFSGCPAPIQPDTVAGHQRSAACVGHPDHCLGRRLLDGLWLDRRAVAAQPDNGDDVEVLSFFEGASPPNFNYFNYPVVAPPPRPPGPHFVAPSQGTEVQELHVNAPVMVAIQGRVFTGDTRSTRPSAMVGCTVPKRIIDAVG